MLYMQIKGGGGDIPKKKNY